MRRFFVSGDVPVRADTAVRPYAEICAMSIDNEPDTPPQRDAGWIVERVCREPDISADGGYKPRIIRRLAGRAPSSMVTIKKSIRQSPVVTIGDGRPT